MSETRNVTCDGCGRDLTTTGNAVDWRLSLAVEPIPLSPGPVTDMYIEPLLDGTRHFCGTKCLKQWAEGGCW